MPEGDKQSTSESKSEETSAKAESWIAPEDLPFVEGEKAKVKIVLSRPATGKGVKAKLKSPAFANEYTLEFDEGESEKEIEITFGSAQESPEHEIVIEPEENCAVGANFCRHIELYPDRPVYFPSRGVLVPNGPFIKDDEAQITVDLLHPAPDKGAKAKLTGPFEKSPLTLDFERGTVRQTAQLKFNNEDQEDQKITIEKVAGCITGEPKEHAVKIRTPKVAFDDPALEIPNLKTAKTKDAGSGKQSAVEVAGEAILKLKLDTPAPVTGSAVRLSSKAFAETKGYEIAFPRHATTSQVTVRIKDDAALVGQTQKVELKTDEIRRCKLGDTKHIEFEVKDVPRIRFAETTINKVSKQHKLGANATLQIEAVPPPTEETRVMVKSTAFGGKAHIVTLKKAAGSKDGSSSNKAAQADLKVAFTRGFPPEKDGKLPDQKIRLVAPEGWLTDRTKKEAKQAGLEPNKACLFVQVETETAESKVKCHDSKAPISGGPGDEAAKSQTLAQAELDLDDPCNLHVMRIKLKHGDTTDAKPLKRGPEENGTFEIVRDKSLAKNPDTAMIYSSGRIPTIEVTACSEIADPAVKSPLTSPHYTTVALEFDEADKYCRQKFIFDSPATEATKGKQPPPRQHPFIHLHERVKGKANRTAASLGKGYDLVTGAQRLPADIYNKAVSVGKALGLPVGSQVILSGSKAPPGPPAPPYAQRYIWKPATQALRFVRKEEVEAAKKKAAKKAPKKGAAKAPALVEGVNPPTFPVFQARQVWFGHVEAGAKMKTAPAKKAAKKKGAKAASGPMIGAPPPDSQVEAQAMAAQDEANAALLKKNLLAALSWTKLSPRQYWLDVEACGTPTTDPADKGGPNSRMQAMIEVYPSDEFCLHFEYNPDLPIMKTGAEGALFKPQKGCGEAGLKPVEKKPEEPSEAEAGKADETVKENRFWQDEEEPPMQEGSSDGGGGEGGEPEGEPEEVEPETTETEEEADVQPPTRGDGSAFLDEANYTDTEKDSEPKKESQVSFSPTLVLHPYKPPKGGINKSSASFINQVVKGIQTNHAVDFVDHVGNTGIDQTAREQGDGARQFLDDNVFKKDCFNISLSRNGVTSPLFLEINQAIGGLIGTVQEVTGVFNRFSGNWVPAQGWGIHLKLKFLEGKLDYYWGWKEHTDNRVFRWFSLQVFLTLLNLKFSIDFALRKHIMMVKFELIVSGHLSIDSVIDKGFERTTPDDKYPDWIDKWDSTEGLADIGARIVLANENTCRVNAAVKTGFLFKYRLSVGLKRRFGVQYEVHFKGLTLDMAFKVKCLKEKKISIPIIKGREDDSPLTAGFFPEKKRVRFKNLDNELNMLLSSVKAKRAVYLEKVHEYQRLQLKMVCDSKKKPDTYPYTQDGFLPGYRYEGEGSGDGDEMWVEQKTKWDKQWNECISAFSGETKKIRGRNSLKRYQVAERLDNKVAEIEKITGEFINRLKGLDALRLKFIGIGDDIADADVEEEERVAKEKEFMAQLKTLSVDKAFKDSSSGLVKKLNGLLADLAFYALKRMQW